MSALEDHPIDPIKKGWGGTIILFYPHEGSAIFVGMGKVPRIKVEQSINTQGERKKKNKVVPSHKAKGTPLQAIHCEAQTAASHYRCK